MLVIRALWGDFSDGCRLSRCWKDVKRAAQMGEQDKCCVLVYGKDNWKTICSMGFEAVLLDDSPFPDGKRDYSNGRTMVRPWHYKFQMIQKAFHMWEQPLVYCDFDVKIHSRPGIFWDHWMEKNRGHCALSLYRYKRPRSTKIERPTKRAKRLTPSGNWIYCANDIFPTAVLDMMAKSPADDYASWHDEFAMNDVIDQRHGGWPGEQVWLEDYESPLMMQKGFRNPWSDEGFPLPAEFEWRPCFSQ